MTSRGREDKQKTAEGQNLAVLYIDLPANKLDPGWN